LAYDLLGGKRGPLRTIARVTGYVALCFIGYVLVVRLRYAIVAASGMGVLLGIEFRIARVNPSHGERHRIVVLFGFLRGLVLAGITVAGPLFGAVYGLLSGAGLTIAYLRGFAPTQDYEAESKPHISRHKMLASLWRAVAVGIAGINSCRCPQRAKNLLDFIRAETRFGGRHCECASRSFQPGY
jgi:hypothetical protein